MRRLALAALVGAFVGCDHRETAPPATQPPPVANRPTHPRQPWKDLEIGDEGIVYSKDSSVLLRTDGVRTGLAGLPVGTRIRFLGEDKGRARIKVLEGDHAEETGTVLIVEVRPAGKARK